MKLVLPWPPTKLNPNSRTHWGERARIAARYKQTCFLLAKQAKIVMPSQQALLQLTFCPPDRRHRDDDNLIAAFKAGRDGIALALSTDDKNLRLASPIWAEQVKKGAIIVELIELKSW